MGRGLRSFRHGNRFGLGALVIIALSLAALAAHAHSPFLYAWARRPLSCHFAAGDAEAKVEVSFLPDEELTRDSMILEARIRQMKLNDGSVIAEKKVRLLCLPHPEMMQCGTPEGAVLAFEYKSISSVEGGGFVVSPAMLLYKPGVRSPAFSGMGTCELRP